MFHTFFTNVAIINRLGIICSLTIFTTSLVLITVAEAIGAVVLTECTPVATFTTDAVD